MEIRIRVPHVPAGLGANLLGAAGLAAIVAAIAALTSWRWALLAAGVFAVALAVIAQYDQARPVPPAGAEPATAPRSRIEAEAERVIAESRRQYDPARAEAPR